MKTSGSSGFHCIMAWCNSFITKVMGPIYHKLRLPYKVAKDGFKLIMPLSETDFKAGSMITSDPDILAGEPVFDGTRVPVRTIAAWLEVGIPEIDIQKAYPAVTEEMLRLAPIYAAAHPQRGRLPKFGDINPDWKLRSTTRVKLSRS